MSKGTIVFTDQTHDYLAEKLQNEGFDCAFRFKDSREDIERDLHKYVGLVCKSRIPINRSFLEFGKNLKFVARAGVGVEHIDIEAAKDFGISVLKSPEGSRDAVGEHTIGMLLGLMNNLMRAHVQVRQKQWIRKPNTGVELKGKTVGILGYGNMGNAFAKRLTGFGCEVIAYDKYKSNYGDQYAAEVRLDELFEKADVLSIHIPYEGGNHYFVNEEFISSFQKDIWLVNTARGLVLETHALVNALESGKVQGAALDVIEYEEMSFDNFTFDNLPAPLEYLLQADNVVLAPHIAGWSEESYEGHARVLADKILAFMKMN
ncbi:MAG: NAD(P)-dependent oxidoreductase [Saprospiraceae bacterium]